MISSPINPSQSLLILIGPKKREQNGNKNFGHGEMILPGLSAIPPDHQDKPVCCRCDGNIVRMDETQKILPSGKIMII